MNHTMDLLVVFAHAHPQHDPASLYLDDFESQLLRRPAGSQPFLHLRCRYSPYFSQ
jgi:hypothetical protein